MQTIKANIVRMFIEPTHTFFHIYRYSRTKSGPPRERGWMTEGNQRERERRASGWGGGGGGWREKVGKEWRQ